MAHFAGRRELGVKFPMGAASVDPKSTQLTPLTIEFLKKKASPQTGFIRLYRSAPAVYVENGGGNPPFLPFFLHFSSFFVHYFLENVTREPPITPKRGIVQFRS